MATTWRGIGRAGPLVAVVTVAAACSQAPATPSVTPPGSSTTAVEAPSAPSTSATERSEEDVSYDPALQPLVDMAVADLAERSGTDPAAVTVAVAELVVWPNQALGCPREGMQYPDVPVDGSRIVLVADGVEYAYHTGGNVYQPFLCENPPEG